MLPFLSSVNALLVFLLQEKTHASLVAFMPVIEHYLTSLAEAVEYFFSELQVTRDANATQPSVVLLPL